MSCFRILGRPCGPIDLALVAGPVRLVRTAGGLWLEAPPGALPVLRPALAYAGLALDPEPLPVAAPDLVVTLGRSLAPLALAGIDAVTLVPVPLGAATAQLLRRRWPHWPDPRGGARTDAACRALLRGTDALARWERRAWLPRAAIREATVRGTFRPIVFDRDARAGLRADGTLRASDGCLGRWLFA